MDVNYSEKIKQLRLQKNMTQKDLANGICSQGLISKIEKNEVDSDIKILSKIADRLEVSVGYLIGEVDETGNNVISPLPEYQSRIRELVEKNEYISLENYFKGISKDTAYLPTDSAYRLWVEAIIKAKNYNMIDDAIQTCEDALAILDAKKRPESGDLELRIDLLNLIANQYATQENPNEAIEYYSKALKLVENKANFLASQIKVLYGLARANSQLLNMLDSNFFAEQALHLSAKTKDLQHIDSLYLLLAENAIFTDDFESAEENAKRAQLIAEIKENTFLIPYINRTFAKLQLKLKNKI